MKIKLVEPEDKAFWMSVNKHVTEKGFVKKINSETGYIMWKNDIPVGVLDFCVLWDNLPFLNFMYVLEEYRNNGFATNAMQQWEVEMKKQGYKMLLLSTQVNEEAQHFYRKRGYIDCGGLILHDTPLKQPMEMFMRKVIE